MRLCLEKKKTFLSVPILDWKISKEGSSVDEEWETILFLCDACSLTNEHTSYCVQYNGWNGNIPEKCAKTKPHNAGKTASCQFHIKYLTHTHTCTCSMHLDYYYYMRNKMTM